MLSTTSKHVTVSINRVMKGLRVADDNSWFFRSIQLPENHDGVPIIMACM